MKKKNPFIKNKNEIFYNLINSLIAGGLVFIGSFASGNITKESLFAALSVALIVAVTKFKHYWDSEKKEYSAMLLNFI